MEPLNLEEALRNVEREFSIGGNMFEFVDGENKVRILDIGDSKNFVPVATHFFDKKTKPATCYGADEGCPYHGDMAPVDKDGNPAKPSIKFLAYVLNRKSNRIELAKLPYTVVKKIVALQKDEDYHFDAFPMPYDLKITYDREAAGALMYSITPSPNREETPSEVGAELLNKKELSRILEEWKEKAKAEDK